jgi:hypothetical protein
MIEKTIRTIPSPPLTVEDELQYEDEMGPFLDALPGLAEDINGFAGQANALDAEMKATAAAVAEDKASTAASATEAAAARDVAVAARNNSVGAADAATLKAAEAVAAAGSAAAHDAAAVAAADRAVAAAASVSKGTDPWQLVRAGDLGTAAWLDQTWLYASVTWDVGSFASGGQTYTTVSVPGASYGDFVLASAYGNLSGLALRGEVVSPDTVSLFLSNMTGSAVDLASATYYIAVLKRIPTR